MRLSEAILLGSLLIKPRAGDLGEPGGSGCALGMALEAMGKDRDYSEVPQQWPWTESRCTRLPCGCWRGWFFEYRVHHAIGHLFDGHVFRRRDWTLARLAEWVASIEPAEDKLASPARTAALGHRAALR